MKKEIIALNYKKNKLNISCNKLQAWQTSAIVIRKISSQIFALVVNKVLMKFLLRKRKKRNFNLFIAKSYFVIIVRWK